MPLTSAKTGWVPRSRHPAAAAVSAAFTKLRLEWVVALRGFISVLTCLILACLPQRARWNEDLFHATETLPHRAARVKAAQDLLPRTPKRCNQVAGWVELHRDRALVFELSKFAIDVAEVHLARAGLVASGNIGDMNEADTLDVVFELFDEVPVGALLVVEVVQHPNGGVIHGPDDRERFGHAVEIDGGILQAIDRLDHADESRSDEH